MPWDSRADNQAAELLQHPAAQLAAVQLCVNIFWQCFQLLIKGHEFDTTRRQEPRHRTAGAAHTDDRHVGGGGPGGDHRILSVDSATSANRNEMIQKRTITLGSAHPLSSK